MPSEFGITRAKSVADLKKDNVEVIGVSFDSTDSHQKFIAKYSMNFTLLADTDGKIADAYGVRMTGRNMAASTYHCPTMKLRQ